MFFLHFFFKLLPKVSYFINSDDCIRHIRLYPVYKQKMKLNLIKKGLFHMRNSDDYNYDYAHSFCGKDF